MNISLALMMQITGQPLTELQIKKDLFTTEITAIWPKFLWFKNKITFTEAELMYKLKRWASYHYYFHLSTEVITFKDSNLLSGYKITLKIPDYIKPENEAEVVFTNENELQAVIDACEYVSRAVYGKF